jgi:hypothetical protein
MMEHGIGHTFGTPAHPDGKGKRDYVSLFLPPNEYTKRKIQVVRPDVPCIPIGTPKMDQYVNRAEHVSNEPPIVAIGFHHGDRRKGERGSAFEHYKEILPELHKRYRLLAYSHPLSEAVHRPIYEQHGIPYTSDFSTVMNTADICINDLSSALYEFLVTWRPVVVLDAPWFRKDVHWGIRFWDYSDIGINVWQPEDLPAAIDKTLLYHETICISERRKAIIDLYPYLGIAARQAAAVLVRYLAGEIP